jgi:c-di-GMP-binding flagellar brake protein YcgR
MPAPTLVPLSSTPIRVGEPLPFPIFDTHGRLLLGAGESPRNEHHIERIHEIGMVEAEVAAMAEAAQRAGAAPAAPASRLDPPAALPARAAEPPRGAECRLTALRMPSGSTVQVSQPGDPPRQLVGTLVGILPRAAVYIGLPAPDGRAPLAARGAPVGFRSVLGTEIVRFDSALLHFDLLPFPVAVLAYPASISVQRFRRHPRAPTALEAVATNYASPDVAAFPCRVVNLSVGGLMLDGPTLGMKPGDQVGVDLVLPGSPPRHALKLMGRVRNATATDDPDVQRCGLEFFELDPPQRLLVENFVLRTLAERPRGG